MEDKRRPTLCKHWENDPFGDVYCNHLNEFIKGRDPSTCTKCTEYAISERMRKLIEEAE